MVGDVGDTFDSVTGKFPESQSTHSVDLDSANCYKVLPPIDEEAEHLIFTPPAKSTNILYTTCIIETSKCRVKTLKVRSTHTYAKLIEIKLLYLQKRHGLHESVRKMESNDTPHGSQFGSLLL